MYDETRVVITDRREMLRVKVKSLAEEARLIRREEQGTRGQLRDELHLHRVGIVRIEARATHLAYGLIKGRTVEAMEPTSTSRDEYLWKKVRAMVQRYGPVNPLLNGALLEKCKD